jgi:hypothetical protein
MVGTVAHVALVHAVGDLHDAEVAAFLYEGRMVGGVTAVAASLSAYDEGL